MDGENGENHGEGQGSPAQGQADGRPESAAKGRLRWSEDLGAKIRDAGRQYMRQYPGLWAQGRPVDGLRRRDRGEDRQSNPDTTNTPRNAPEDLPGSSLKPPAAHVSYPRLPPPSLSSSSDSGHVIREGSSLAKDDGYKQLTETEKSETRRRCALALSYLGVFLILAVFYTAFIWMLIVPIQRGTNDNKVNNNKNKPVEFVETIEVSDTITPIHALSSPHWTPILGNLTTVMTAFRVANFMDETGEVAERFSRAIKDLQYKDTRISDWVGNNVFKSLWRATQYGHAQHYDQLYSALKVVLAHSLGLLKECDARCEAFTGMERVMRDGIGKTEEALTQVTLDASAKVFVQPSAGEVERDRTKHRRLKEMQGLWVSTLPHVSAAQRGICQETLRRRRIHDKTRVMYTIVETHLSRLTKQAKIAAKATYQTVKPYEKPTATRPSRAFEFHGFVQGVKEPVYAELTTALQLRSIFVDVYELDPVNEKAVQTVRTTLFPRDTGSL